jgi:hypothetical protein
MRLTQKPSIPHLIDVETLHQFREAKLTCEFTKEKPKNHKRRTNLRKVAVRNAAKGVFNHYGLGEAPAMLKVISMVSDTLS